MGQVRSMRDERVGRANAQTHLPSALLGTTAQTHGEPLCQSHSVASGAGVASTPFDARALVLPVLNVLTVLSNQPHQPPGASDLPAPFRPT
jgi:hypothetical protein